jgi:hypothetical protein
MKKGTSKTKLNRGSRKTGFKHRTKDMAPKKDVRGGLNFTRKPVDQDFH